MRTLTLRSACVTACAFTAVAVTAPPSLAQQVAPARPAQTTRPADTPTPTPPATTAGQRRAAERPGLPQGFSVVLVLGDIQGTATPDDVPPAARKALADMRDFLPFKSYKLLDASWVMCCGQQRSGAGDARPSGQNSSGSTQMLSQVLRGPEEQEYELKLMTSRTENARVFVRFSLSGAGAAQEVMAESTAALSRTTTRKIADLRDQATLLEKQIQEVKRRVDVGTSPGTEIPKLEVDLRRVNREIEDLTVRLAEERAGRAGARSSAAMTPQARSSIIDTSFTMDVGETVVVGTSRLKGGTKAIIALLTAVPPRTTTERRE
jgi:hypothetical protein